MILVQAIQEGVPNRNGNVYPVGSAAWLGKQLFHVDQLPDGALPSYSVPVPDGFVAVRDERNAS